MLAMSYRIHHLASLQHGPDLVPTDLVPVLDDEPVGLKFRALVEPLLEVEVEPGHSDELDQGAYGSGSRSFCQGTRVV